MDVNTIVTLVVAFGGLGGAAGIITAISNAISQHKRDKELSVKEQIQEAMRPLLEEIKGLQARAARRDDELREIRLDTTRTQMYIKMEHEPHNHDTILLIARRYFEELQGDWCATSDFLAWAERENVKVPQSILDTISRNKHEA